MKSIRDRIFGPVGNDSIPAKQYIVRNLISFREARYWSRPILSFIPGDQSCREALFMLAHSSVMTKIDLMARAGILGRSMTSEGVIDGLGEKRRGGGWEDSIQIAKEHLDAMPML